MFKLNACCRCYSIVQENCVLLSSIINVCCQWMMDNDGNDRSKIFSFNRANVFFIVTYLGWYMLKKTCSFLVLSLSWFHCSCNWQVCEVASFRMTACKCFFAKDNVLSVFYNAHHRAGEEWICNLKTTFHFLPEGNPIVILLITFCSQANPREVQIL